MDKRVTCPMCNQGSVRELKAYDQESRDFNIVVHYEKAPDYLIGTGRDTSCPLCYRSQCVPERWAVAFRLLFSDYEANSLYVNHLPGPSDISYLRST